MDNGLIFPYPLYSAHADPSNAKRHEAGDPSGKLVESRDPNW
jgi:hypothetical protein